MDIDGLEIMISRNVKELLYQFFETDMEKRPNIGEVIKEKIFKSREAPRDIDLGKQYPFFIESSRKNDIDGYVSEYSFLGIDLQRKQFVRLVVQNINDSQRIKDFQGIKNRYVNRIFEVNEEVVVREYYNQGTLFEYLARLNKLNKSLNERRILKLATSLVEVLVYLRNSTRLKNYLWVHSKKLVVNDGIIRLTEPLSIENSVYEGKQNQVDFFAPDFKRSCDIFYDKADVWSFGVLIYSLVTNKMPKLDNTTQQINLQLLQDKGGQHMSSILSRCLQINSADRMSLENLFKELKEAEEWDQDFQQISEDEDEPSKIEDRTQNNLTNKQTKKEIQLSSQIPPHKANQSGENMKNVLSSSEQDETLKVKGHNKFLNTKVYLLNDTIYTNKDTEINVNQNVALKLEENMSLRKNQADLNQSHNELSLLGNANNRSHLGLKKDEESQKQEQLTQKNPANNVLELKYFNSKNIRIEYMRVLLKLIFIAGLMVLYFGNSLINSVRGINFSSNYVLTEYVSSDKTSSSQVLVKSEYIGGYDYTRSMDECFQNQYYESAAIKSFLLESKALKVYSIVCLVSTILLISLKFYQTVRFDFFSALRTTRDPRKAPQNKYLMPTFLISQFEFASIYYAHYQVFSLFHFGEFGNCFSIRRQSGIFFITDSIKYMLTQEYGNYLSIVGFTFLIIALFQFVSLYKMIRSPLLTSVLYSNNIFRLSKILSLGFVSLFIGRLGILQNFQPTFIKDDLGIFRILFTVSAQALQVIYIIPEVFEFSLLILDILLEIGVKKVSLSQLASNHKYETFKDTRKVYIEELVLKKNNSIQIQKSPLRGKQVKN